MFNDNDEGDDCITNRQFESLNTVVWRFGKRGIAWAKDDCVRRSSQERSLSRFLEDIQINPLEILRLIAVFLKLKKINKLGWIVDRTNWKRGKQHLKEISSEARYLASQGEDSRFIHQWFEGLPKGKSQTVVLELGKTAGVTTALTAKRLEDPPTLCELWAAGRAFCLPRF